MRKTLLLSLFLSLFAAMGFAKTTTDENFQGFNYAAASNLWKAIDDASAYTTSYYYAPNWGQIADPAFKQEGDTYTWELPVATYEQWQAQCFLIPNNLTLSSQKTYDFSCVITASADGNVTVKLPNVADDGKYLFADRFKIKAGQRIVYYMTDCAGFDDVAKLIFDFGGSNANCTMKVSHITLKDHAVDDGTEMPGENADVAKGYEYSSEANLWKAIDAASDYKTRFWYAPGWNQIADPSFAQQGSEYTFGLPAATSDQWQAQCFITPTRLQLTSDINYDFSCIVTSTTDISHVTVKLTDKTSDGYFLFTEVFPVKANVPQVLKLSDLAGINADCELVLDFGGNGDNCTVKVKDIVLKDHAIADASEFNGYSYEHAANLWRPIEQSGSYSPSFWYAPGWNQIADPDYSLEGSKHTFTFPQATTDQWQAQCFLNPSELKLTSSLHYDFSCIITTSTAVSHVTVKLTDKTSDGNFLFTETFPMEAGETNVFCLTDLPGIDADCKLVLDFGGNGDNCVATVERITLKDHAVDDGTRLPGQKDPSEDTTVEEAYATYEGKCKEILGEITTKEFVCDERDVLYYYLTENEGPSETYPNGTSLYVLAGKTLDKDALLAEIAYLDNLYLQMINAALTEGTDVTYFLTNAGMNQAGFKGWDMTINKRGGSYNANSNVGMDFWPCAESWNTAFDCHQTVEGLPNGLYEIGVYAYYRPGPMDSYMPDAVIPCELYMNEFFTPVMNIIDDPLPEEEAVDQVNCRLTAPDGIQTWSTDFLSPYGYIPNGEWASSFAFASGRYYQKVYGMVTDGQMTLGIRSTGEPWYEDGVAYWSKFRLIYMGKNIDALNGVIESYAKRAEVLLSQSESYHYRELDNMLNARLEAARASKDADAKYQDVIEINQIFNLISNSIAVYVELANAVEYFQVQIFDENNHLSKEQKDACFAIYEQVWDNILSGTYTDEEALAKTQELKNYDFTSGIQLVTRVDGNEEVTVYTLGGQQVTRGKASQLDLKPGIYVICSQKQADKVFIK